MVIKSQVLQLLCKSLSLHAFSLKLGLVLKQLRGCILVIVTKSVEVSEIGLKGLVHLDLDELFETLILFDFDIHVGLLRD